MNNKPLKPCNRTGCQKLTRERFCADHTKDSQAYDRNRQTAAQRGYDSKWRKVRRAYLLKHPLCVECTEEEQVTAATVVDHIIPHKGDKALFWDSKNWQPLCKSHHDRKTAREDGGFGNRV